MASCPITSRWGNNGNSDRLYFLGLHNAADGDCSHEIKGHLLFGRKAMTNLDSKLRSRHIQIRSDQSLSHVRLFATPRIAARQASLSITNSRSSLRLTAIESVIPSSHLILCHSLLLPPSIFPSISIFTNESVFHIR